MELLEVLDNEGKPTGELLDKDLVHEQGLYHREVALFLINTDNEVLLQKRSSTKKIEPNKWAWHGGHVMAYESLEDAILRETREELGITLKKKDLKGLIELKRDKLPNRQFTFVYYAFYDGNVDGFNIQKEELSEVRWFKLETIRKMVEESHQDMMFKNNESTNKIISALEKVIVWK